MYVVGYMFVLRIHGYVDDKCDVWLSCVLVIFVKMGQKRISLILMFLNGFMELSWWIGLSRISVFNCHILVRNRLGENWGFELKVVLSTFEK